MWSRITLVFLLLGSGDGLSAADYECPAHPELSMGHRNWWIEHVREDHEDFYLQHKDYMEEKRPRPTKTKEVVQAFAEYCKGNELPSSGSVSPLPARRRRSSADQQPVGRSSPEKKLRSSKSPEVLVVKERAVLPPLMTPSAYKEHCKDRSLCTPLSDAEFLAASILSTEERASWRLLDEPRTKAFLWRFFRADSAEESLDLIRNFLKLKKEDQIIWEADASDGKLTADEKFIAKFSDVTVTGEADGDMIGLDDRIYWLRRLPLFSAITAKSFHDFLSVNKLY